METAGNIFGDSYQLLFENNPLPLWVQEERTQRILEVNPAALRHYGYTREEFLELAAHALRPPEESTGLESGGSTRCFGHPDAITHSPTQRHRQKGGTLICVELFCQPLEFRGQKACLVMVNDVTEQLRAQEALFESEQLHRATLAAISDTVFITDDAGQFVYICPNVEVMGYTTAQVQGMGTIDGLLGGPFPELDLLEKQIEVRDLQREITYPDGSRRWLLINLKRVRIGSGTRLYVCRDITDLKHAQQALQHNKRRLDEAQHLARLGSWEWDAVGDLAFWSDEMYQLCGVEDRGQSITRLSFLAMVHPEDRVSLHGIVDHGMATGQDIESPFRLVRPDGSVRIMHGRAGFVRDAQGRTVRMMGTIQDLTEKKESEIAMQRARDLEVANQELESFSYSVAHDLRAPMRHILASVGILREECGLRFEGDGAQCLATIQSAAQRMGQLIDDLLSLARVSGEPLNRERFNLSDLAGAVVQQLRATQPDRQIQITVDPDLEARADLRLTRILLENLLGNAWKFTRYASAAAIHLGRVQREEEVFFYVRDNGAGFDSTQALRLFRPFERLHSASRFEGTGIGLATVQRIVRRHGGTVRAEAKPDEGATFYFTLESSGA
jgi:PAS domain S-box-containing protein